jgi:hypothetical protein
MGIAQVSASRALCRNLSAGAQIRGLDSERLCGTQHNFEMLTDACRKSF